MEALQGGLRELGWVEGKNVVVRFRWAESVEQLPELAAQFVRLNVDVILAMSSTMVEPARRATKAIPIVFAAHADPVGIGHVASLARPGGNITGMSMLATDLAGKRLELLREMLPGLKRLAALGNAGNPVTAPEMREVQSAARTLGFQIVTSEIRRAEEIPAVIESFQNHGGRAALHLCNPTRC